MPIYEYQCQACGHRFDALQKVSESPLSDCPECAKPALKKLISAPNFRLKGSGWYETDFKKDKKRNLVEGDKPASADKPGENKTDAKPATDKQDKKEKKDKPAAKKNGSGDQAA